MGDPGVPVGPPWTHRGQAAKRLRLYQIVLTEGEREDIENFLDASYLMTVWPMLRRLLNKRYTGPWLAEEAHLALGMPEVQHTGYPDI